METQNGAMDGQMDTNGPERVPLNEPYMLAVLEKVRFGRWNQGGRFLADLVANGVRTDRQRWWLCKLVQRHRKQHNNRDALEQAEAWLAAHGAAFEPKAREYVKPSGTRLAEKVYTEPTLF